MAKTASQKAIANLQKEVQDLKLQITTLQERVTEKEETIKAMENNPSIVEALLSALSATPVKEKAPYTGKPRGRKKKVDA